jgi:tetratricopeptide (TPR) repeat protein
LPNNSNLIQFPRLFAAFVLAVFFAFPLCAQKNTNGSAPEVNASDSISEFMLRGAVMSLAAVQSKYESLEAGSGGNQILSRQKSGEAQNYFNQSRSFYRKALVYDSLYAPAWNSLGTTYFLQDLPEQSLPFYRKAFSINPKYSVAVLNTGKAFYKMNKMDSALFYFEKSVKVDSSYVAGYIEQARLLSDIKKDNKSALQVLNASLKYCGQNETPLLMISEIHFQQGDSIAAVAAIESAARLNPGNIERTEFLASWFERHGNPEKAKEFRLIAERERNRIAPREKDHESTK